MPKMSKKLSKTINYVFKNINKKPVEELVALIRPHVEEIKRLSNA